VLCADRSGCTKRSAARPLTDESGTIVTVEETSFASVLETTMHERVFGTSALNTDNAAAVQIAQAVQPLRSVQDVSEI